MKSKRFLTVVALITMVCALFVGCPGGLKSLISLFVPNLDNMINSAVETAKGSATDYLKDYLGDNVLAGETKLPQSIPGIGPLTWSIKEPGARAITVDGVTLNDNGTFTIDDSVTGNEVKITLEVAFEILGQKYNIELPPINVIKEILANTSDEVLADLALTYASDVNFDSNNIVEIQPTEFIQSYQDEGGNNQEHKVDIIYEYVAELDGQVKYEQDTNDPTAAASITILRGIKPKYVKLPVKLKKNGTNITPGINTNSLNPIARAASATEGRNYVSVFIPAVNDTTYGLKFSDGVLLIEKRERKATVLISSYGVPEVTFEQGQNTIKGTFTASLYDITTQGSLVSYRQKDLYDKLVLLCDEEAKARIQDLKENTELTEEYKREIFEQYEVKYGDYEKLEKQMPIVMKNALNPELEALYFYNKPFEYTITQSGGDAPTVEIYPLYDTAKPWYENMNERNGCGVCDIINDSGQGGRQMMIKCRYEPFETFRHILTLNGDFDYWIDGNTLRPMNDTITETLTVSIDKEAHTVTITGSIPIPSDNMTINEGSGTTPAMIEEKPQTFELNHTFKYQAEKLNANILTSPLFSHWF